MADSSFLKLRAGAGMIALVLGLSAFTAYAETPIVLTNDTSIPAEKLQAPQPNKAATTSRGAAVPMAARPETSVGTARPTPTAEIASPAISAPMLDSSTPSLDQIEAALTAQVRTSPATPPTPPGENNAVAVVSAPDRDQINTGLGQVLRALPPPLDPATARPAVSPEVAPPTFRVSATRFVPNDISGNRLPTPTPTLTQTQTIPAPDLASRGVAPVPTPVAAVPQIPAPLLPIPTDTGSVALNQMAPASSGAAPLPIVTSAPAVAAKPRLVIEGPQSMVAPPVAMTAPRMPVHIVDTFRARKGESLRDVIRRWADRAGIDLVWAMPGDVVLTKDFSYVGKFETALNGLIAAYPESGLKTNFVDQGPRPDMAPKPYIAESAPPAVPPVPVSGAELADFVPPVPLQAVSTVEPAAQAPMSMDMMAAPVPIAPPPAPMMTAQAPQAAPRVIAPMAALPTPIVAPPVMATAAPAPQQGVTSFGPTGRWRALSGASMRQVIQAWADDSGIPLIWAAPQDFVVRYSVNTKADYGRAIHDLLGQYAFEPVRPTGQIYRDPATGQSTLVVRVIRG